jgi:hypothetical protein
MQKGKDLDPKREREDKEVAELVTKVKKNQPAGTSARRQGPMWE